MGHEAVIVSLSIHDKVLLLADVVIDVAVEVDFFFVLCILRNWKKSNYSCYGNKNHTELTKGDSLDINWRITVLLKIFITYYDCNESRFLSEVKYPDICIVFYL